MPISWKGTLIQYSGRLHRHHPGKKKVRIYDYVDWDVPMLTAQRYLLNSQQSLRVPFQLIERSRELDLLVDLALGLRRAIREERSKIIRSDYGKK